MKVNTIRRKKAIRGFEQVYGRQEIIERLYQIYQMGKLGFDAFMKEIGRMAAETIMYIPACRRQGAGGDIRA